MDVEDIPLTSKLVQGYALEMMESGRTCETKELEELILDRHKKDGGRAPQTANPRAPFTKGFGALKDAGQIASPAYRYWQLREDAQPIPTESDLETDAVAEITFGEGAETICGWYFQRDRKLAGYEETDSYPVKIGRTKRGPENRIRESGGYYPERPTFGFALKVDDAMNRERLLHSFPHLSGRHIPDGVAVGTEWFSTSPDELLRIVTVLDRILKDDDPA